MPSVYELATLSAMVYDSSKNRFQDWHLRRWHGDKNGKGFYAESYTNRSKREIVLAIKGTDFRDKDWKDFYADLQICLGRIPYQLSHAKEALKIEEQSAGPGNNLFLTGHSLGGAVASILAVQQVVRKFPVVTFNSPGMQNSHIKSHIIDLIGSYNYHYYCDISKFLHIRANADLVSIGTGPHMGKVESVFVNEWGNGKVLGASRHLAQHSIDNLVISLESKPWYKKDLFFSATTVTPKMLAKLSKQAAS